MDTTSSHIPPQGAPLEVKNEQKESSLWWNLLGTHHQAAVQQLKEHLLGSPTEWNKQLKRKT